jgi:hypothetical protein
MISIYIESERSERTAVPQAKFQSAVSLFYGFNF